MNAQYFLTKLMLYCHISTNILLSICIIHSLCIIMLTITTNKVKSYEVSSIRGHNHYINV